MTRQEMPPIPTRSDAVLETQWDRVGHAISSDRSRRPVGREKKEETAVSQFWDTRHKVVLFLRATSVSTCLLCYVCILLGGVIVTCRSCNE